MKQATFDSLMYCDVAQVQASDEMVANAARVSTLGEHAEQADHQRDEGLINFLMKNRHGCYDSQTEVLTSDGWTAWPSITGSEIFATLNLSTRKIEYQQATQVVHKHIDGPMIRIKMQHVDMLVTPDHNMVAAPRVHGGAVTYELLPAKNFLLRSHRIPMAIGDWDGGSLHCPGTAELIGFIVADAHVGTSIEFNLRNNSRKVKWLRERFPAVTEYGDQRYGLFHPASDLKRWAKDTYTEDRSRKFPTELLRDGDAETLDALLRGYLAGDGNTSPTGKVTCATTSRQLVDDIQELAVKTGYGATEIKPCVNRESAYGSKPLFRITICRQRNSEPKVGWTPATRKKQVSIVNYSGDIHCVTVPNGTLYVRRNGKPAWCGNTPFEHGMFVFRVRVPIFVMREVYTHRVGMSRNEESGRYRQLEGLFYIPGPFRPLTQVGRPAAYTFTAGTPRQIDAVSAALRVNSMDAWYRYNELLADGIAKEVARMVLPLNIYSACYLTCNSRSLMHFLSLRVEDASSTFPSHPMAEIDALARQMELSFKHAMPATHKAFCANGRVAPLWTLAPSVRVTPCAVATSPARTFSN